MVAISPAQCRAARALLNWSQRELEIRSGVSKTAIADFERGASAPYSRTLEELIETFEKAGIMLQSPEDGVAGAGVRFKWGAPITEQSSQRPKEGGGESDPTLAAFHDASAEDCIRDRALWDYWKNRQKDWSQLSRDGREILLRAMIDDTSTILTERFP